MCTATAGQQGNVFFRIPSTFVNVAFPIEQSHQLNGHFHGENLEIVAQGSVTPRPAHASNFVFRSARTLYLGELMSPQEGAEPLRQPHPVRLEEVPSSARDSSAQA